MSILMEYTVVPKDNGGIWAVLRPKPSTDGLLAALRQSVLKVDKEAECTYEGDALHIVSVAIPFVSVLRPVRVLAKGLGDPIDKVKFKSVGATDSRVNLYIEFDMTAEELAEFVLRKPII